MATNYFIGIGGTGARCLEALIYLTAAGVLTDDINVLLIDPDSNNGNSTVTNNLLTSYHTLQRARQPADPKTRSLWGTSELPLPTLFRARINNEGIRPARWNSVQRNTGRKFEDVISYTACPDKLKRFINLFYQPDDLNMTLDVGYQGRTNVGSVALKQDLEVTADTSTAGFREFLEALGGDLEHETKVFVAGSIFGGTGAAGIPTIPALIKSLESDFFRRENRKNLRWGTALMAPYFTFPQAAGANGNLGPGTNSTLHPIAAKAALMYYAFTPPGYNHVYLMGAPNRSNTNNENRPGGEAQRNLPHYAELVSALSAVDFYSRTNIDPGDKQLHYADSFQNGQDLGVCWDTLPVFSNNPRINREEVKQKLVNFTTFAYIYHKILHEPFILSQQYKSSATYNQNFVNKNLNLESSGETQTLSHLNTFCAGYLNWLSGIYATAGNPAPILFDSEALTLNDPDLCAERIGILMRQGTLLNTTAAVPVYHDSGYGRVMENLNKLKLVSPETQSGAGLFIYLLSQSVGQYCRKNYNWRNAS